MTDEKKDPPPPPVVWPEIGSRWKDDSGRALVVQEIRKGDPLHRNIVGRLTDGSNTSGVDYACSMQVFEVIWKPA